MFLPVDPFVRGTSMDTPSPSPVMPGRRRAAGFLVALLVGAGAAAVAKAQPSAPPTVRVSRAQAPARLSDTGLYEDVAAHRVRPDNLPYAPQYPLWSDGARKQRWIHLPPATAIDASDPDVWEFPVGTRIWKEFAFGRRVETRYMERAPDGAWILATYRWNEDESDADLVPALGARGAYVIRPGLRHDIPSRLDCAACHADRATPVLGFSALQLSPDRDPLAPHAETPVAGAVDLPGLVERGLLRGLPARWLARAPRIEAPTPRARAALGYLHANCGSCHTATAPALPALGLALDVALGRDRPVPAALATAVGRPSRFRLPGAAAGPSVRVAAGDPEHSVLYRRFTSRNALLQMPPLGTHVVDAEAAALLEVWIREDLPAPAPSATPPSDHPRLSQE